MELKETYKQLTSVDIDEQRQIWDQRGRGYYGEYLLFCELYRHVPGTFKILMNLIIPVKEDSTTEIDLLLIHETGLYIFECKHYSGIIYGKDTDNSWTQFMKTTPNHCFMNPISQNGYHIRALKKIYPNLPIRSFVVFTNDDCKLRLTNSNPEITICTLNKVNNIFKTKFAQANTILSIEEIDNIFNKLSPYSQMSDIVTINNNEAPFYSWIQPTISDLQEKKAEIEQEKIKYIESGKKIKKIKWKGILINVAVAIICIIVSVLVVIGFHKGYESKINKNNAELAEFKQNFLHVDEIDNEYIDALNSYIEVSDVVLSPLTDDAVSFSAKLTLNNDAYSIRIMEDAKYIVVTDSGLVYEYDIFGESLKYYAYDNTLGKYYRMSGKLAAKEFYGISDTSSITYIKLTDVQLLKTGINNTLIKDNLEIELYSKK